MTNQPTAAPAWEPAFLAALAETGVVRRATAAAGISPRVAYRQRRRDPEFAASWSAVIVGKHPARPLPGEPVLRGAGWKKIFLEALATSSNVSASATLAQVPATNAYKLRRTDPQFRAQWQAALLEGYEHLEMETLDRLRTGTAAAGERRFDVANALRLLALHKETVARERALCEDEDEDAILASLDAKIEAMRAREEAAARLLLASEPDAAGDA